jgi:hypothetical protein
MPLPALTRQKKITFGEMRAGGVLQVQPLDGDQR